MTTDEWTVSALAQAVRQTLEGQFGTVRVRGELGRVTRHGSGHMYFDLKDAEAVIHAAWFKAARHRDAIALESGAEVVVTGRLSSYPARSEYQLIVTGVSLAGVGALLKLIEDRKNRLAAEGLFAPERKQSLPYLPRTIGIITSPTGAVIQDMLHRLRDRFLPHVLLWPVAVQGEGAAAQVCAAVEGFQTLTPRPDVLIIARGGGSVEDLMPFNDEALVRTVAACTIPVISAIGHETDWTLLDLVADVRAPTPTGAAEFAVPVKAGLEAGVLDLQARLGSAAIRALRQRRDRLEGYRRALVHPRALLETRLQQLDDRAARLSRALAQWLTSRRLRLARLTLRHPGELAARQRQRLEAVERLLKAVSYQRTLERGFALALSQEGRLIPRAAVAPQHLRLRFADGELAVSREAEAG